MVATLSLSVSPHFSPSHIKLVKYKPQTNKNDNQNLCNSVYHNIKYSLHIFIQDRGSQVSIVIVGVRLAFIKNNLEHSSKNIICGKPISYFLAM